MYRHHIQVERTILAHHANPSIARIACSVSVHNVDQYPHYELPNVPADIQRQILIRTIGGCGIVYLSWIIIGEMFLGHAAKTRLQHIMQEMLPTSPLKKFLTQVAWTIILLAGTGVTFCLAHIVCMALFMAFYYFADICRILMDLMSDSFGIDCTTPQALYLIDYHTNLTAGNIGYYLSMASIYTGIFWGLSLCIIGGVLLCHR